MFPSTLSIGAPDPLRASTLLRGLGLDGHASADKTAAREAVKSLAKTPVSETARGRLSPSLVDDLRRFEHDGIRTELIEVVAASLRHGTNMLVHLGYGSHELPLTLFPAKRLMHCPLLLPQLLSLRLTDLFVLGVEPAEHAAPELDDGNTSPWSPPSQVASMDLLSWDLAMRGARSELLPEISPQAAFRIPPGVSLQGFDIDGAMTAALHRLKRRASNLKDLSSWAGFDRERAMRLLNGLYLQSALMATRTHPAATGDVWS
jgi:hypothetical protein